MATRAKNRQVPEASDGTDLPPEVQRFCETNNLLPYLPAAVELTKRLFPSKTAPTTHLECDPNTGERWVTIDVTADGSTEELLDSEDEYIDEFVAVVPWPERDMIRLSY